MTPAVSPFYFVKSGDNLSRIAARIYGLWDPGAIHRKAMELYRANPHLTSPDRIYEGQVLYLGSGLDLSSNVAATDLLEMQSVLQYGSRQDNEFLLDHFMTLQTVSHHQESLSRSIANDVNFGALIPGAKSVQAMSRAGIGLLGRGLDTATRAIGGQFGNLLKMTPFQFEIVHGEMVRSINKNIRYIKTDSSLRLIPTHIRAFSSSHGKVFLVEPSAAGLRKYSETLGKVKSYAGSLKSMKHAASNIGVALDVVGAGMNVAQDWETSRRVRTSVKESVALGGKLGARAITGTVATSACGFLTITTGVGGVVCYFGVALAFGYVSGQLARGAGEFVAVVYESATSKEIEK